MLMVWYGTVRNEMKYYDIVIDCDTGTIFRCSFFLLMNFSLIGLPHITVPYGTVRQIKNLPNFLFDLLLHCTVRT